MQAGYLRKNRVPYSENAVLTEYFDVSPLPNGGPLLLVTAVVEDSRYSPATVHRKLTIQKRDRRF